MSLDVVSERPTPRITGLRGGRGPASAPPTRLAT